MKFSCERAALLSAVSIASRAAAVKSSVPSLEGLLIEAVGERISVTGYDLKTGICSSLSGEVTENGSIVISARLFGDIVRRLPDDIVYIRSDVNNSVEITCGMSEFSIIGFSSEDYPDLPSVDGQSSVYIKESAIKALISETIFAVSDNEARPIHTGALFETAGGYVTVVAVDGYRLALRREQTDPSTDIVDSSFVVPGAALSEVEKIASDSDELVRIVPGSKHISFTVGKTMLISRRLEGEFLNYRNSIPKTGKYTLEVNRRAFVDAVERVSLIINDRIKSPVRCVFSDNVVKVQTSTPLGSAADECAVKGDGENLEIGFNNRYLLDAFKAAPADDMRVILSSGISPCVVGPADGSDSFIYMILPVRLRANEG